MGGSDAAAPYVAEFVGTFLLVFTVGCNVAVGSATWGVTSIAFVLMVSIYALGSVSGANLNPAVTLGLVLAKRKALSDNLPKASGYVVAQLSGGLVAGGAYVAAFGTAFNLQPGDGFGWVPALCVEVIYTCVLVLTVLATACRTRTVPNQHYGLAIGFSVIAGGYAGGWISGGCFNPAVAFGVDASSAKLGFGWCFAWAAAECLGAAIAAMAFLVLYPEEDEQGTMQLDTIYRKLLAEFIGTFLLVLTVGLAVLSGSGAAAWAIAASLTVGIYMLAGAGSGCHFNPAVTVGILVSGRGLIDIGTAAKYIGTQVFGGLVAGIMYVSLTGSAVALAPGTKSNIVSAMIAELVFTFVLVFVVLSIATVRKVSVKLFDMIGFVVGACVIVGGYAIGAVSGGSLNPAVSIAIDTAHLLKHGTWINCVLYSAAEFAGAAAAAGVFALTHPAEYISK